MYLLFWQTFIKSLSNCQRDHLLLDVLCNGRGRMDYSKQLVANSEDPDPHRPANTNCPNWCICNVCMDMGNEEENKVYVELNPTCVPTCNARLQCNSTHPPSLYARDSGEQLH